MDTNDGSPLIHNPVDNIPSPPLHQQLKHLSPLFLVRMSPRIIRSRRSTRGVNRSTTEARLQYARVRLAVQSSRK